MPKNFQPTIDELQAIIHSSRNGRLSAADEQKGATLFKELLMSGGKALSSALELLGDLPWFVLVNGTLEAWPGLSPAKQRNFLNALKALESESSRRMRFSIARGLYKLDPGAALKLLIGTLQNLRKENGLESKDRQIFSNVFLGKNKPWLLQVDLNSLKTAEAQTLALTAIECSAAANPPSAMAVIQWAKPFQPLGTVPEQLQLDMSKSFRKWSSRWQKELAKEDLPPILSEVVQTKLAKSAQQHHAAMVQKSSGSSAVSDQGIPSPPQQNQAGISHGRSNHGRHQKSDFKREKPAQQPKAGQEIPELLKQLQLRFQQLREDLESARAQLKQSQQFSRKTEATLTTPSKEITTLREENAQLSDTVRQLRETLNDLSNAHFDTAVSRKVDTEDPVTDPLEQFKSLLALRLREQMVEFQTLNRESHVDGLPLLLDNILNILQESGIDLSNLETPPPPVRRRY